MVLKNPGKILSKNPVSKKISKILSNHDTPTGNFRSCSHFARPAPTECHARVRIRSAMHENHYHFSPATAILPVALMGIFVVVRESATAAVAVAHRPTISSFRHVSWRLVRSPASLCPSLCQIVSSPLDPLLRKQNASLIIPRSVPPSLRPLRSVARSVVAVIFCLLAPQLRRGIIGGSRQGRRQQAWHTERGREGREGGPRGKIHPISPCPQAARSLPLSPRSRFSFPSLPPPLSSSS